MNKPYLIAEIGCNHMGDLETAHQMIKVAASFCQVDAVKFQKRDVRALLSEQEYNAPHPNPRNSFGATYGEHREFLEFNVDQHKQLMDWCTEEGIVYSTSVWDTPSALAIVPLNPQFIKVPSASNLDFEMLSVLTDNYAGEIHVSLGMTTRDEEQQLIKFLEKKGAMARTVIYHCTSGYPVPFDQLNLLDILKLKSQYGAAAKAIGFSGHHLGIAADIAALALGATHIERHFTLDRTWKGTDHAASLEPDGMRKLARDLRNVHLGLTEKKSDFTTVELEQRKKLKRKVER